MGTFSPPYISINKLINKLNQVLTSTRHIGPQSTRSQTQDQDQDQEGAISADAGTNIAAERSWNRHRDRGL